MNNHPKGTLTPRRNSIPVSGLYENWAFTADEIAPYVFKVQGQNIGYQTVVGYGGTVEEALQNCIKKAERIDHPFEGFNILWLLTDKIIDNIGILIGRIRGITD